MLIKRNIADALNNKGNRRRIFKQEIRIWVEKKVSNIKKMETLDSENCAEMRKIEDDYYTYIMKCKRKNKAEFSEELLQLLKELSLLESITLLKTIVYNNTKIRHILHPEDTELFMEMHRRIQALYKQEREIEYLTKKENAC